MEIIDAEYQFDRNKLTFFFRLVVSAHLKLTTLSYMFHYYYVGNFMIPCLFIMLLFPFPARLYHHPVFQVDCGK